MKKLSAYTELENLLKTPEYKLPLIKLTAEELKNNDYIKMEECNGVLGNSFHNIFDRYLESEKRIPTPVEFIEEQYYQFESNYGDYNWRKRNRIKFTLTSVVEKGIKQRLLRSYRSFVNELHTELMLSSLSGLTLSRSVELDYSGIDIQAYVESVNTTFNIHITKRSNYALEYLWKKEGKKLKFIKKKNCLYSRPIWTDLDHPIYSKRDFSGHIFLLYDEFTSDSTRVVNGYPLFKISYVKNKLLIRSNKRSA